LVLGSIVMLTMLTVDFAFNQQTEYQMADYQIKRLQAEYLARSSMNLMWLEMKYNQMAKSTVASAGLDSQISFDLSVPLCEQFPLSSGLLRAVASGAGLPGAGEGEGEEAAKEGSVEEKAKLFSGMGVMGGEEFLNFEGDFDGECGDESGKIDLNYFYSLDPTQRVEKGENGYDRYKKLILYLLSQEKFRPLFENRDPSLPEIVRNLADWVDKDDRVNEFGGTAIGSEDSEYIGETSLGTKNGKMTTPWDVYQVAGITDDWWIPVQDMFTIYGGGKVNVCRAPDDVVVATILQYVASREDLPPIRSEDTETLSALVDTVKNSCQGVRPDPNQIATDLNTKLAELMRVEITGGGKEFADNIATQSRFFFFRTAGQVGDVVVRLTAVLDFGQGSGTDTSKWKLLYWRMD